ncbi:hypothetical protein F925_00828 [Acinetobacter lwoffii NCTC 5866 = CIP 64.10 = NIPH 512]|nr:hypothetical protein F925_00828 [Acinetobacter lwoffii NCTC 5866 = CIP 64.10 = NIPH 512]
MLTRLVKQIWLVMLMVFAIGWSSVSVASATTMHLVMSSEQMSSHCLDMVKASTSHAMHESAHNSDQDLTQADCFPDMPQHSPDCLDCGTTACQSLITSLPIAAPELSVPDRSYPEKFRLSAYHGKHLAGYWQEILRPPKA